MIFNGEALSSRGNMRRERILFQNVPSLVSGRIKAQKLTSRALGVS